MATIPLNKFLKNLKELQKNPYDVVKKEGAILIYLSLRQMAKYTVVDTGQAKSMLIKKFCERFSEYGFKYEDLESEVNALRYWETHGFPENQARDFGKGDSDVSISESSHPSKYSLKLSIRDDGLYNQEKGIISQNAKDKSGVPRDNSRFKPAHISYVVSLMNEGMFESISDLNMDKIVDAISTRITNRLFRG